MAPTTAERSVGYSRVGDLQPAIGGRRQTTQWTGRQASFPEG
jgi:hypothetical protein